jgi:hypothetical protein
VQGLWRRVGLGDPVHAKPAPVRRLHPSPCHLLPQLWRMIKSEDGGCTAEFLLAITLHSATVNVVRWSPSGEYLVSGGDGTTAVCVGGPCFVLARTNSRPIPLPLPFHVEGAVPLSLAPPRAPYAHPAQSVCARPKVRSARARSPCGA